MKKKYAGIFFLGLIVCLMGLVSCGIEDYTYLYPVPSGNISVTLNQGAAVRLPNIDLTDYYYFTNFTIYYRIYISGTSYPTIHTGNMNDLNPALYSDYSAILPYTNNDTNISTSVGTLFRNRNYYTLTVEGMNIDELLNDYALGETIALDFSVSNPQPIPSMSIYGRAYNLQRSTGNGLFRPVPDNRYFFNTPELNSSANIVSSINADVADRTGITDDRYTYVSMYIVVTGIDNNFSPIYSAPTHIGVFYLPNP